MDHDEEDRRRIARELHDDIGQRLALFADDADTLRRYLQITDAENRQRLDSLVQQARNLSEDLRRISHSLHPAVLEDLGFPPALRSLIEDFSRRTGMRVNFVESNTVPSLLLPQSTALYRIAQEALRNVAKHAGHASVDISLSSSRGELVLIISDSGCGFDTVKQSGLGLTSMRERAILVGATLKISSTPGKGTVIQVNLPFARAQAR